MENVNLLDGQLWPEMPHSVHQLDRRPAMTLLDTVRVGRVAFTHNALPVIRTVSHIVDDGVIVIRTHLGMAIVSHAAAGGAVVAYEADDLGPSSRLGWSVFVTGTAQIVHDDDQIKRYDLRIPGWVPGTRDSYLYIQPTLVTGYILSAFSPNGHREIGRTDRSRGA